MKYLDFEILKEYLKIKENKEILSVEKDASPKTKLKK